MFRRVVSKAATMQLRPVAARTFHSTAILRSEGAEKAVTPEVQAIVDSVLKLNIMQTLELVKTLKTTFGYTEASFAVGAPAAAAPAAAAAPVEEVVVAAAKTSFTLKLESYDAASKVKVIKEVRTITGKGLKEAKELVESVPQVLKKDCNKEEADKLVALLKEAGAVCILE